MIPKLTDLPESALKGKKVFVRVDFNVPMEAGAITDDTRIQGALPTLKFLLEKGAALILASHLGRPKGKRKMEFSLEPVAARLAELLGKEVIFPDDCIGDGVEKLAREMEAGDVMLLENVRFHAGEEANDPNFCAELAKLADTYVNDAFGTAHRAEGSVEGVARRFPWGRRAVGFLVEKELAFLQGALDEPKRPFVAVLGGAKVSDKIGVIRALLKKADTVLIGGAMAYTLLRAKNVSVGKSLVEEEKLEEARHILALAEGSRARLVLPMDHLAASSMDAAEGIAVDTIPEGLAGYDIGPKTISMFKGHLNQAKTVFWNGPMGVFEKPAFSKGTFAIAEAMADLSAVTVVGGGDSVAAVQEAGVAARMSHISTGGGASLELVEGCALPAIVALEQR
jgi:phosphoglycerate kinase